MSGTAEERIEQIWSILEQCGQGDYMGERVSQLEHCLQAANLALDAGADEETILAALLHDIGRFIPAAAHAEILVAADGSYVGKAHHEVLGEEYLRQMGFSPKVYTLVGAHVMAKRYLSAVDQGYWESLSRLSKQSLELQGGRMTSDEVEGLSSDPHLEDKLRVRRWDDLAKDPSRKALPLSTYQAMAMANLSREHSDPEA